MYQARPSVLLRLTAIAAFIAGMAVWTQPARAHGDDEDHNRGDATVVAGGTVTSNTSTDIRANGGRARAEANGGDDNVVTVGGGGGAGGTGNGRIDIEVGNGGTVTTDASGGDVTVGAINSGGNTGNVITVGGRGGGTGGPGAGPVIEPDDFSPNVTNPLFPLAPGESRVYVGEEFDPETGETVEIRVVETDLAETAVVAGVEVRVVEVKEYEDGELVEVTRDYYAQHEDGTVYYLGEDVDKYENGVVVSHEGSWLAGEGQNQPGIFMPADPQVGETFEQERAPGVAEDSSTVIAVGLTVTTPAGTFSDCIRTRDVNPLDGTTEFKTYCPGVGLVSEESADGTANLELVEIQ